MGSIVIKKFLGEAPRVAEEELPDGAGQKAKNVKLHSGDLIPYKKPQFIQNSNAANAVKGLYKLTIPYSNNSSYPKGSNVFLTWDTDVDIVSSSPAWATSSDTATADEEQRYYYTGDGQPKVSTYDKATRNVSLLGQVPLPYTDGCYNLGLPIPTQSLIATAVSLSAAVSTHYERDSGNYATFYANANHGLRSGNIVTIRDFGSSDEAKSFNAQNVEVTVTSPTTFTYFNSGDAVAKTANTNGRADLAGNTSLRTYVYTWVTPWGEESLPSIPSNEVYVKEGQTVDLKNIPFVSPSNNTTDFIRGIRMYRSVTTTDASDYFLLKTVWFPTTSVLGDTEDQDSGVYTKEFKGILHTHSVDKEVVYYNSSTTHKQTNDHEPTGTGFYRPGFPHNLVAGDVCQMVHNNLVAGTNQYGQDLNGDSEGQVGGDGTIGKWFGRFEQVIEAAPTRYTLETEFVGSASGSDIGGGHPHHDLSQVTDVVIYYSMNESDTFISIDENYEDYPAGVTPTTRTVNEDITESEISWGGASLAGDSWSNAIVKIDGTDELVFSQWSNSGTFYLRVIRGYRGTPKKAFSNGTTIRRVRAKNKYARFFHGLARSDRSGASSSNRARSSNVATFNTSGTHNLEDGEIVTIYGYGGTGYNVTDVPVTVVDHNTFTYPCTGSDENQANDSGGRVKRTGFRDDFNVLNLSVVLPSRDYDAPPEGLKGLRIAFNNILIGFFDNQLCFSFPEKPHAWPEKFRMSFDYDIVAVETIGGVIFVMTEGYPYQVSGADPATMASARIDTFYPCVSKQSVVNMGYGVVYATVGGLASFSPGTGLSLITGLVHDWETWESNLIPSTIVGHYYDGKYFGCHSTGSFIFERDDKIGGYLVSIGTNFEAAYTDTLTSQLYFVDPSTKHIFEWDNPNSGFDVLEWKSKVIRTPNFMNLGAAKVIADFEISEQTAEAIAASNALIPALNLAHWMPQLHSYTSSRLNETLTDSDTTLTVDTGLTAASTGTVDGGDFIKIDDEYMYVSADTSTTLTVIRGMLGTTAAAHANDSIITPFKVMPLGSLNGSVDFIDLNGQRVSNFHGLNSFELNGDGRTSYQQSTTQPQALIFKLYADKNLIFSGPITSSDIFRLPTGYKSDTFEIEVSGDARIREIQIGETPYGLRSV